MPRAYAMVFLAFIVLAPMAILMGCAAGNTDELTVDVLRSVEVGSDCVLRSIARSQGAVPFPVKSNPFVSDDPVIIRFVSMWALMPAQSEEALAAYTEEQFEAEVGLIKSVYVAMYEPVGGGPETGVYGLQFEESVPRELRERLESNTALVSGRLAVLVWTDAQDAGCYDVLRDGVVELLR
jgi:hypothetical protein